MAGFGAKVKLTVDKSGKQEFNNQINSMVNQIKISNKFTVLQKDMDRVRREAQTMLNNGQIILKVKKIDCSAAVTDVKNQLQTMLSALSVSNGVNITGLRDFIGADGVDATLQKTATAATAVIDKMNQAKASASDWAVQMKLLDNISKSLSNTYRSGLSGKSMIGDEAELGQITARYNEWLRKIEEIRASKTASSTEEFSALQQEGIAIQRKITMLQSEQTEQAKAAAAAERKAAAEATAAARSEEANAEQIASLKQISILQERLSKYLTSNSRLSGTPFGGSIRQMLEELNSGAPITVTRLRAIEDKFADIRSQATQAGLSGRSMFDMINRAYQRFGGWTLITRSLTAAIRGIRQMFTNVKELDAALTQITIVTGVSGDELVKFADKAAKAAKAVGTSIKDIVSSTETFARLGLSLNDSLTMGTLTAQYANVAATTVDDATLSLTSIMKAFNYTADEMTNVVDMMVKVGQEYAVSAAELGEALQHGGSALEAGGNTLEQSIALIAAGNAAVQNASTVGNALKTTSMRIRSSTAELEEMGEEIDDIVKSASAYRAEIKALSGVDIMVDDSTYKSTYEILKEIANVWERMSDIEQATLLEDLAGKRNANTIKSIINNIQDLEGAYNAASNASGTLATANAAYMDSIEARMAQFTAAFEELSNTFINSDFVKGFVSFGTGVVESLTAIIEHLGSIPALITAITAAYTIFKGAKGLNSGLFTVDGTQIGIANTALSSLIKNFDAARTSGLGFVSSLKSSFGGFWAGANGDISEYNRLLGSSMQTQTIFMKYIEGSNSSLAAYLSSLNGSKASLAGYQAYCQQAGISTGALGASSRLAAVGVTALNVALNMLISLGITLLIQGIITAFREWYKSTEELVESSNKLKESFAEFKQQTESHINTIESLRDEFEKLSDGVDRYGRNISLSAGDYERYKEIIKQVVDLSPQLIEGYDKENGYLVDKNNLLERAIELQNQEYQNELRSIATTPKLAEAMAGSVATYSDLKNGDALTTDTDLTNSIYRLFNINNRKNIPKGEDHGEYLAKEIMRALGVDNIDREMEKYFNEHGYYQSGWFFDDYIDRIAEDLQSANSRIIPLLNYEDLEFDSSDALDTAIEEARDAASAYSDVQTQLANANQDVADQLKHIAESNNKYAELSENAKKIVSNFVDTFGVEDVTKDGWFGGKEIDEDAINHIKVQINDFIDKFTPEIQAMVDEGLSLKLGVDVNGNELSVKEYQRQVRNFLRDVENLEDEDLKLYIRTSLDIDEDATSLNNEIDRAIAHVKNLLVDAPVDKSELENLLSWYKKEIDDAKELGVDLSKTVYGNIDTNNRQVLEWTEENLEQYRDVIDSWKSNDEQLEDVIENLRGSMSTIMGTSEDFDGVEIAFSPILQTENGPVYLDKDTLEQYINDLIGKAGNNWTSEDLLRLDAEGLEYDGLRIQNMLADIGETAINTGEAMHYVGDLGGIQTAYNELREAALNAGMTVEELNEAIESGDFDKLRTVQEIVDDLSVDKALHIYYNISADPHSMTFDELQRKLDLLGVDWSKTINVWDFSPMVESLDDIESKVSDVVSAMNSLQNGTKLTVEEMAKLALKYPELLKASNLFTDTSIDNQKALLDSILGTYESEYDALVDTKIAELTATNELIKSQIELENEKKNKVIEIADLQANGKLDSERDYQKLLDELHDLEGQNFVTYSDGVLDVNEDMLTKMLENEGEDVDKSKPIWGALGDMIIEGHTDGLGGALKAFPQYLTKLKDWAGSSLKTLLSNIGTNIGKAFSGDMDFVKLTDGIQNLGSVSVGNVTIETSVEGGYTIDDKSVDDWAADYKDTIENRVKTLTDQISANEAIIDNLKKLKGLDLKSLYSNGSGSKSGSNSNAKELEEYIVDIDAYYEALKRLEAIQIRLSALENGLENASSEREKIGLTEQLISVYKDEIDALETLNGLRKDTIQNSIRELQALGFEIDYNSDTNEFLVHNLEHLNELEGKTLEETNELRKGTEELINTLDDLNTANQEGVESIRSYRGEIKSAKQDIIDDLKGLVTSASDAVDEIQNVFDTLKEAADEYAENGGFISVDAFQKIIDLGPQYMQYLRDENGLLVINEENINRVIAAKVRQLAAEQALTYVERLRYALESDSIENLNTLLYATTEATDATFGLAYAELALMQQLGQLDDDQYAAALHNIQAIESLANTTIEGIGRVAGESSEKVREELENMKSGVDDILKYVMDMLKHRIQQQIDALEDLKDAYGDIIDLRKEALDAAKKEAEYEDEVAEKVKQIAKLQERINALSLDDSRDAQAQKVKLEEELAEIQKELADDQSDYAVDAQKDALDDMQEAYEREKDGEIAALEETINSYQKLYDMAIEYIENHWNTLYDELISWNTEYGSVLNSEITEAWNNCLAAAQRYGSYVSALNNIDADISAAGNGSSGKGTSNNTIVGATSKPTQSSNEDHIHAIIKEMYRNSQEHHTANQDRKNWLSNRNLQLGAMLSQYGVKTHRDNGTWYMDGSKELLYDKYRRYIYHKGGVAGDKPTLKQNEVMAILEKGEPVLDKKKEEGLYRIIDFTTVLSEKFGKAIASMDMSHLFGNMRSIEDKLSGTLNNVAGNQTTSVQFGDVYIYGGSEETAERHREINRQFTNEILKQLNIKR